MGDRAANLKQAIGCYKEALRDFTPEADPFGYGEPRATWAIASRELPAGDRAANLRQAIACFEEALRFRTAEAAPVGYAMTQNCLGIAYRRPAHRGPDGEPRAGHRLLRAGPARPHPRGRPPGLRHDPEQPGQRLPPVAGEDRADNLQQAIACFEQALRFSTPEAAPLDYATTQNNLGAAYRQLPRGTGRPTCSRPSPASSRPCTSGPPRPPPWTTP